MKRTTDIDVFLVLLERQTFLMDELTRAEASLQEQIADRNWVAVEELIREMGTVGEVLAEVEEARNKAFLDIAQSFGGGTDFGVVLSRLPTDIREAVSQRYRDLKVAVLRLQSRTAGIDAYLRSSVATNREVLRELFPEHTTSGYSSSGHGREHAGRALMVNEHH